MLSEGRVEHGQWLIRPESRHVDLSNEIQEMNVPPTIIEMNVASIISKLNEVITVMKNFDIQVNLGNIYGTINQIVQQFNFLQDAKRNYPMMMKLLANVNSRLTITNQGIKLLSATYAEVAKNHSMYSNSLCYLDTMTTPRISMSYSRVIKCTSLKGRVDMCHFTS